MKTKLFLLAMVTIALAGCTDDLERRSSYSPEGALQASIPAYPFDNGTRVSISDDLQTFTWSNGDQIGIYYLDGDITAHAGFGILTGGGTTGTFTNSAFSLHPSSTYYGFFPFDENATVSEAPVDFTGQVQTVNESAAHLGAKNYMYSVVNTDGNGNAQINFHNLGSVMAIRVAAPATKTYSRLIIQSSNVGFTTKGNVNMANGRVSPTASSNLIILSFGPEGLAMNEGDMMSLYLLTAPENLSSSTLTFTLSAMEGGTNHLIGSMTGKNMLQGRAYLYDFTNKDAPYVTFTADATQTLRMNQEVPSLEYSVNGGAWQVLGTNTVTFGGTNGDLRLRGKSSVGTNGATISFGNTTPVTCSGDIRTLVDYENYETTNTGSAKFNSLFSNCSALVTAPDLPATNLAPNCYTGMFGNCTSLTSAPKLPATTLSDFCYIMMFVGCTSLTQAPELPATTLTPYCYYGMFQNCSQLSYIRMMATDISAPNCLNYWVYGVSSSGTFVKNKIATWDESGIVPAGWTVETMDGTPYVTFTSNTVQTLRMSQEVSSLQYSVNGGTWSTLGTSIVTFGGMNGDIRLRGKSSVGTNGATITFGYTTPVTCSGDIRTLVDYENYDTANTSQAVFKELFKDCTQLTTAPRLPATTLADYCYESMFRGCTSLTQAPKLPATTLAYAAYHCMFQNCSSLTTAPELPATNLESAVYQSMFGGCTSLTTAPELPATTLASSCYGDMFAGCISLTRAPELPARTLAPACYISMFAGCQNLNYIKMMATDISAIMCLTSWVSNVSSTGTFVKNAAATWNVTGVNGIPEGWTVQTASE